MTAPATREGFLHESAPLLFGVGQAVFSADRVYRYRLTRTWGESGTHAVWIMLNPSKAGAVESDPTVGRVTSFTKAWGLDGFIVVNLHALVATDPRALRSHPDPVGPANDQFIRDAIEPASVIVAAWGAHPFAADRAAEVGRLIAGRGARCLGVTKGGHPKHPLYVPSAAGLVPYPMEVPGA